VLRNSTIITRYSYKTDTSTEYSNKYPKCSNNSSKSPNKRTKYSHKNRTTLNIPQYCQEIPLPTPEYSNKPPTCSNNPFKSSNNRTKCSNKNQTTIRTAQSCQGKSRPHPSFLITHQNVLINLRNH